MKIDEKLYAKVLLHADEHYNGDYTLIRRDNGYYFCFEYCWEIDSEVLSNMAFGETAEEAMAAGLLSDTHYRECDTVFNHELYKNDFTPRIREKGYIKYMSTAEAERKWKKPKGTVRVDCNRGRFDEFFNNGLIQKVGGLWLLSERAMELVYGNPYRKSV